ncbi:phospholipid-translocating P-type ATPase [Linderina pennispora]|uniref:Phospholipid-translocating P-type ATPase n=1 Tax=Linderina pennispora TaxID=61395 RepID=A0A1Y1VZL1_9FUNG|nr:phospholipid-translocating P-type ATPase [Linderina pennispora]ORX66708.1 phospholipid-translocating P-type ATPase [Linderina pennispora]
MNMRSGRFGGYAQPASGRHAEEPDEIPLRRLSSASGRDSLSDSIGTPLMATQDDMHNDMVALNLGQPPPLNPLDNSYKTKFAANVVSNNKYNFVTFLPLVLFEQFKFFFNLYFLLVALSQFVPQLRIGYLVTYVGPLVFVLAVTMAKEWHDDHARKKRDKEANSQKYARLSSDGREVIPSAKIRDQRVPADMVLLRTTEASGACFIRTDQLDGETDWKLRIAAAPTQKLADDMDIFSLHGAVYAGAPHKDIYDFVGNLTIERGLPGSSGPDTRAAMNTGQAKTKVGILDTEILFLVTLILSLAMVALDGFKAVWYVTLFRFLILFSSIIPISLRVNLDMGKTFYSMGIERDKEIPDTVVRNSMIPEELGRIEYCLTDKTGTLTRNEMELKRIHMGIMAYTLETSDEVTRHSWSRDSAGQAADVAETKPAALAVGHGKARRDMPQRVFDMVESLALCHNVTPTADYAHDDASVAVNEVAIVKWTEHVGVDALIPASQSGYGIAPTLAYDILQVFPFTSESKRMGIVVQSQHSGEIYFIQKGADTYNDWLDEECGNMARDGLRTLVVGRKRLSKEAYNRFERAYQQAKVTVLGRAEAMQQVVADYLESDLELLGLTGVEDRLQDNVPTTLELLGNAGIKVWMLTGDKVETATCVAISAKLVKRDQLIHVISGLKSAHQVNDALETFIEIAVKLSAVVCCRCSPTQKADIVRLIRRFTKKRVLAVGDGGNDVSMIQAADVGVGLVGKEGKQASLAADFSGRLLLWHGRNSYKRSAKLAQFVIHRGLIISIMQAVFSALFYFAPIALVPGNAAWRSLSYKTFFTWLLISIYQGGALMMIAVWLLLMVALEIRTWHRLMIWSILGSLVIYIASIWVLPAYFDASFILSGAFIWKTLVITAVSSVPLYIIKLISRIYAPPSYAKLT